MAITPINFSQINSAPNTSTQAPTPLPKKSGLFSKLVTGAENIGKDAFNTLIGNPATRFGQVVGNAIAPALGVPKANIDYANSQSQELPFGMGTVPAQKGGLAGAEQIGGQTLKAGAYLAPEFMGAEGIASKGIINGAVQGVKIGATSGALGGAGNAMSQGADASDVVNAGMSGAGTGALTGGVIGGATGLVGNVWEKAYGSGGSYQSNLNNAIKANSQAGTQAIDSIHEASNTISDVSRGVSNQFAEAPKIISKVDPGAGTTASTDLLYKMQSLKDTKAWSLPNSVRDAIPTDINGPIKFNPQQTQDILSSLNDLKFNSKGDVVVNQQTSNLINEFKDAAQSGMGHVVDNEGQSVWSRAYQDYSQVQNAKSAMSNLIPIKKSAGEMLDPTKVNDSVNEMMKMLKTTQGTSALTRANAEFKSVTGYDLLNDPMGSIAKLADSNVDVARALKGGYGHQFIKGLENPSIASRRVIFAITTILGITGLGTAFRKQIGKFLSGE